MNQQKRNNRKFFYLLVGMLLLVGAIGVVSAKQTASIYDAPDLHLVQGSEKYDLLEGITYDSGKYELAVKDTVDFDINQTGEYQVSYTLTPKGKATTSKEESGEKVRSTEKEREEQSIEKSAVQSTGDDKTEVQPAKAGTAVSENKDEVITQTEETTVAEQSDEEASVETQATEAISEEDKSGEKASKGTEADREEETILFKRTVFVDAQVVDGYYLYAPVLTVNPGSTDYDLLEGVELRKAETDEKVADAKITVKDESGLEAGAMTAEEVAAYQEENSGEAVVTDGNESEEGTTKNNIAEADNSQDTEDTETDSVSDRTGTNPALKEGTYEVVIEAENPETEEALTVDREVAVYADIQYNRFNWEAVEADKNYYVTTANHQEGYVQDLWVSGIEYRRVLGMMEPGTGAKYTTVDYRTGKTMESDYPKIFAEDRKFFEYMQRVDDDILDTVTIEDAANLETIRYEDGQIYSGYGWIYNNERFGKGKNISVYKWKNKKSTLADYAGRSANLYLGFWDGLMEDRWDYAQRNEEWARWYIRGDEYLGINGGSAFTSITPRVDTAASALYDTEGKVPFDWYPGYENTEYGWITGYGSYGYYKGLVGETEIRGPMRGYYAQRPPNDLWTLTPTATYRGAEAAMYAKYGPVRYTRYGQNYTEANWKNFGEGAGLYGWDTGEWLDDPDVTIRKTETTDKNEYSHIPNLFDEKSELNQVTGIPGSEDKTSSVVVNYDSGGENKIEDFWSVRWLPDQGFDAVAPSIGQISIKNLKLNNSYNNGSRSAHWFYINRDYQVLRFDSLVGNNYGWDWDWNAAHTTGFGRNMVGLVTSGGKYFPHSVVQVKLADQDQQMPAYLFGEGSIGRYMIKAGKAEPQLDIQITRFMESVQIDTDPGDGSEGIVKLVTLRTDDTTASDSIIEFKGTGTIQMSKVTDNKMHLWTRDYPGWYNAYGGRFYEVKANILRLLDDGTRFLSANGVSGTNLKINFVESDGNRLKCGKSGVNSAYAKDSKIPYNPIDFTTADVGYVFAEAYKSTEEGGLLDATDFTLTNPKAGTDGLYLTQDMQEKNGKIYSRVVLKQFKQPGSESLLEHPIQLKNTEGVIGYYDTYQAAFEEIEKQDSNNAEYTITNLVEWNFEKTDNDALQKVTKAKSITFESGTRTDNDGAAGNLYRIRMRAQNLELPAGVDVTFQNIVMKYDQGTNTEAKDADGNITSYEMTFAGNGGTLTFGDGVVFLKHNDETMTPTVYGGSMTTNLTGDSKVVVTSDCTAHFAAIYGAGTKEQTGNATVEIYGGTIENPIYGGGDGADVTGSTTVKVNNKNLGVTDTFQSIYGGGKGGKVTKDTTVTVTVPNQADAGAFYLDTISGSGTNADGTALADNVTGDKNVTITMKDDASTGTLELKNLAGFTTLALGDTNTTYTNSIFKVSDRFDSNAEDTDVARNGTVNLNHSTLFITSKDRQGRIESLVVNGESELNVCKGSSTNPLKVDGTVTINDTTTLWLNAWKVDEAKKDNVLGDKLFEFKDASSAQKAYSQNRNRFVDGSGNTPGLSVGSETKYILFKDSTGHDVTSWVEYPTNADNNTVLADKLDQNINHDAVQKILHFDYDDSNLHQVRDGYVIAMPKSLIENGNAEEQKVYSVVNSTFLNNDEFTDSVFEDGTKDPNKARNYWQIKFTATGTDQNATGAVGVTTEDGQTEAAIPVDNEKYIYIAHIVCNDNNKDQDVTSFIVDTSAPKQVTEATKVDQIDFDGITENNEYTLSVTDPTLTENELPVKDSSGTQMTYTPSGISQVFWAVGDGTGNGEADAQAAKRVVSDDQINKDGTGLNGTGTVTVDGKMKLTIPKAKIDKAKEQKQNLWVYVKDSENNTTKMMINLDEDVINVKVPMKVSVVAVKRQDKNEQPELLTPICYVVNDGSNKVKAEVNGFATTKEADNLKLSDKAINASFTSNEIALFLKQIENPSNATNIFDETNVKSISKAKALGIGTMEAYIAVQDQTRSADTTLSFTFDAAYDVKNINIPNGWIENTMSYHFTVEK